MPVIGGCSLWEHRLYTQKEYGIHRDLSISAAGVQPILRETAREVNRPQTEEASFSFSRSRGSSGADPGRQWFTGKGIVNNARKNAPAPRG